MIEEIIPKDAPGDFNQGLIELGAIVCVPNGEPKCAACPLEALCKAHKEGREMDFPVKKKAKARRIEKRTVFIFGIMKKWQSGNGLKKDSLPECMNFRMWKGTSGQRK